MNNPNQIANLRFVPVDASAFESVSYVASSRTLYVKFRNGLPSLTFANVPGFRYDGLLAAPRKDAYFKTFIENQFLTTPIKLP